MDSRSRQIRLGRFVLALGLLAAVASNVVVSRLSSAAELRANPNGLCVNAPIPPADALARNGPLLSIAQVADGFAGAGLSSNQQSLYIHMANPSSAAAHMAFNALKELDWELPGQYQVREARYSIEDLARWYACGRNYAWQDPGVAGAYIDQANNSLFFGVRDQAAKRRVEHLLANELGIPPDAVVVKVTGAAVPE